MTCRWGFTGKWAGIVTGGTGLEIGLDTVTETVRAGDSRGAAAVEGGERGLTVVGEIGVYELVGGMTSNCIGVVEESEGNTESGVVTLEMADAFSSNSKASSSPSS